MRRVIRRRVIRRKRRKAGTPGIDHDESGQNQPQAKIALAAAIPEPEAIVPDPVSESEPSSGPALYMAIPGSNGQGPTVIVGDASKQRRPAVLPIINEPVADATVGVIGRPMFREQVHSILNLIPQVSLAFEHEGPVTHKMVSEHPSTGVVIVDSESGKQMARRAPVLNSGDVLSQVPVVLLADPAGFRPPNEVAVVIGRHWSVLLLTSAENPLRLSRTIQKAAAGKQTLDTGIDPRLIRMADELSVERKAPKR